MNNRPKDPKTARNKNVLIIGGSGSGKTRFWLKPNLLQFHSSYVVTDPKGKVLIGWSMDDTTDVLIQSADEIKVYGADEADESEDVTPSEAGSDISAISKDAAGIVVDSDTEVMSSDGIPDFITYKLNYVLPEPEVTEDEDAGGSATPSDSQEAAKLKAINNTVNAADTATDSDAKGDGDAREPILVSYFPLGSTIESMPADDMTLYPVMAEDTDGNGIVDFEQATLSYDGNGHTGGEVPESVIVKEGNEVTLALGNSLSLSGYRFSGWEIDGREYNAGDSYVLTKDVTAKAVWDRNSSGSTGNGSGGHGSSGSGGGFGSGGSSGSHGGTGSNGSGSGSGSGSNGSASGGGNGSASGSNGSGSGPGRKSRGPHGAPWIQHSIQFY